MREYCHLGAEREYVRLREANSRLKAKHKLRGKREREVDEDVGVFDGDALIHAGIPATYVPEVMTDILE